MKNVIIGALLIVIALLTFGARDHSGAQAVIQDTTVHHADYAMSCQPLMPIQPTKPKMHPFSRKTDTA